MSRLYTRKGDAGTTKKFGCDQTMSKNSTTAEALGVLDELNSFLGLVKVRATKSDLEIGGKDIGTIVGWVQNCLFTVQAEVAGAGKTVRADTVKEVESIIDMIEREMPPIETFSISGGIEMAALLDISRTLARTAERRVIAGVESGEIEVCKATMSFLNRSSSLFYALARLTNHKSGINEESPRYE